MFFPSKPVEEGILKYKYGFPLNYITIYQHDESSVWFFNNFFNGNAGLFLNPLNIIINAIVLYLIMDYFIKLINKTKTVNKN